MRRNIFTGYIIRNRLNLETFFEPIIDFIEIGPVPLRELYMRLSSRTAQAKTPKYWSERICNRKFDTYYFPTPSVLKIRIKNLKVLLCGDNTKISSWLSHLYLDPYGPLESSLPYFFLFLLFVFVCNVYYLFSLLLIGILLLRPDESIKTPDSY